MAMTLYDAAFATLSHHFGASYRTALTTLTLFGGFASTIFWPLSHQGLIHIGWRDTLALFAAVHLFICLPVHWWLIPDGRGREHAEPSPIVAVSDAVAKQSSRAPFLALAIAFA